MPSDAERRRTARVSALRCHAPAVPRAGLSCADASLERRLASGNPPQREARPFTRPLTRSAGWNTSGAGAAHPPPPTPAPPCRGHYGLGTWVVLGSIVPTAVTDDEDPAVSPPGGPEQKWPS